MPTGNTYVESTASASQQAFNFTFDYLESSHIIVNVDGTDYEEGEGGAFDFAVQETPTRRIFFTTGLTGGETVRVYRNTLGKDNTDTAIDTTFTDGSIQTAEDLNKVIKQAIYLAVEKGDFETDLADSDGNGGAVLAFNDTTKKWEVIPINLQYDSTNGTFAFGGTPSADYAHKFVGDFLVRQDGTSNGAVLTVENTDATNTNAVLILASQSPVVQFYDTNGSTDKKYLNLQHQDGTLTFQPVDDAGSALATIPLKLVEDGGVIMPDLPTSDPSVTGEIWTRNGVLVLSGDDLDLDALSDVSVTSPTTNQVVMYTGSGWNNSTLDIRDLGDVNTSGASNRDILEYDGSDWVPKDRNVYDSGWVTAWNATTLAANTFDSVTMTTAVDGYFPFKVSIWGRLASSPNEVYPLDSAVAQSSASGTVGIQVKYNESTRDLTLYFQDVAVWHEATSGFGSTLLWGGGIDEIRVIIQ